MCQQCGTRFQHSCVCYTEAGMLKAGEEKNESGQACDFADSQSAANYFVSLTGESQNRRPDPGFCGSGANLPEERN